MELIIIALIAVEVVIVKFIPFLQSFHLTEFCFLYQALIRDGPELWHMVFGPEEKEA